MDTLTSEAPGGSFCFIHWFTMRYSLYILFAFMIHCLSLGPPAPAFSRQCMNIAISVSVALSHRKCLVKIVPPVKVDRCGFLGVFCVFLCVVFFFSFFFSRCRVRNLCLSAVSLLLGET